MGRGVDAGVERGVVLALRQGDDRGLAGDGVGVGVRRIAADVSAGEDRTCRLTELHLVLHARRQAIEGVDAVGAGDGGCRGVANAVDDAIGAAAGQRDGLAADARFAGILLAVAVGIGPQAVAQAGLEQFAEVVLDAVAAGDEDDVADDVVDGDVAARRAGSFLAVGEGRRLGLADSVGAWWQRRELVEAAGVGGRRCRDCVAGAIGARQRQRDAGDRRFCIAHAVVADVLVDVAGHLGRGVDAGVDGGVVFAGDERDDLGFAGGDIGIGIRYIVADVGAGEDRSGRLAELNLVFRARRQAGEGVGAVSAGDGGGGGVTDAVDQAIGAAADQRDRLAADACLAGVLLAVAVGVVPQAVAQARLMIEARIERAVVFARSEDHDIRHQRVAVGVRRCAAVGLARTDGVKAGGQDEAHLVRQRRSQPHERVMARGVGGGGGQQLVGVVEVAIAVVVAYQLDGGAGDARFAGVLRAVGVQVMPDVIAQLGRLRLDHQWLVVVGGVVENVQHHRDRLPHIRHIAVVREGHRRQVIDLCDILGTDVAGRRRPAQHFPDRALHVAVRDGRLVGVVIPEQPVDTVKVVQRVARRQRRDSGEGADFVGGVDVGRVRVWRRNVDIAREAPAVVHRAAREGRVQIGTGSYGNVKRARI